MVLGPGVGGVFYGRVYKPLLDFNLKHTIKPSLPGQEMYLSPRGKAFKTVGLGTIQRGYDPELPMTDLGKWRSTNPAL